MGISDQHVQWTSHDKSEHVLRGLRFFAPRRDSKIDQVVQAGQCYLSLVPAAYLSSPSYVLIAKQGLAKRSDVTPPGTLSSKTSILLASRVVHQKSESEFEVPNMTSSL
jgi:hypothetical protein